MAKLEDRRDRPRLPPCGGAGLLQPHHAGRPRDAPETGVLAVDRQQPPSRWMCRRRIRRPAPCARPRAAAAAALADSTRVVVEAAAPLWSPRARSGEVARSGERGGEGPWHASRAARGLLQVLGWPKLLRFPRWVLADLSKKRHASFYHILAIVVKNWPGSECNIPASLRVLCLQQ